MLCGLIDFAFNSLPYSSIGMPEEWQGGEGSEVKRAQFSDHRHGLEWTLTERSTAELADAILGKGCALAEVLWLEGCGLARLVCFGESEWECQPFLFFFLSSN